MSSHDYICTIQGSKVMMARLVTWGVRAGGVLESDARRVISVLFYWGYIIIWFILLFWEQFRGNET